jgi:DNA-binding MarR family transcriptional regulator
MARSDVTAVLLAYPQVYMSCHVRHPRRRTTETAVSVGEIEVLVHVAAGGLGLSALARHLGLALPSVSATVERLVKRGLLVRTRAAADRRRVELRCTAAGIRAVERDSVLDPKRVARMLAELEPAERARAVDGLVLLAAAARKLGGRRPQEEG